MNHQEILENMAKGREAGLLHQDSEDQHLDGRIVTLRGQPMVNLASCSYLGLETHPALKAGAIAATEAYGTQFSISRAYISAPMTERIEDLLTQMTGRPSLLCPTTSLGHQAALPALVAEGDLVLMDQFAHSSVQLAGHLLRLAGHAVQTLPHMNLDALDRKIERAKGRRVWLLMDGALSMHGSIAPFADLAERLESHENLLLYIDDAHSTGWAGKNGRGLALDHFADHPRVVVALSLNKSFACAGGLLALPDKETRNLIRVTGAALNASGPIQPPMLGAIAASAELHLSDELPALQKALIERINMVNAAAAKRQLPLTSEHLTPIRYFRVGDTYKAGGIAIDLQKSGFYLSCVSHPAVPHRDAGLRISLTLQQKEEDLIELLDLMSEAF